MLDASFPKRFRILCDEVLRRGWKRVILLGDDLLEGPYTLKACLAQSGVMVFVPGPQDRGWLQRLATAAKMDGLPDEASLNRLAALLADGMEHGVDAFVATDSVMAALVRACMADAQILDVTEDPDDSRHSAACAGQ